MAYMNGFEEEPTASMIDQYRSHLKEVWTNAHRKWEKYDDYYFRTFSVWDGAESHSRPGWLKPARATSLVDNAVDHQLASNPHRTVTPLVSLRVRDRTPTRSKQH